jgi:hypothetical protein
MTRTNCDLFTHKSTRSYLNHLVLTFDNHFYIYFLLKIWVLRTPLYFCFIRITFVLTERMHTPSDNVHTSYKSHRYRNTAK